MSALPLLAAAAVRPVVVGLTGGIGMGKSTATSWFRRCGIPVHDSDAAVHELYAPGGAAVAPVLAAFPAARDACGGVDRVALSQAVVSAGREKALALLESIVHPLVTASRTRFVEDQVRAGEWLLVVDVPLLLETVQDEAELRKQVDLVLLVSAPPEVQRARVLARLGMTEEKLDAILARQLPDELKRQRADVIIDTGLSDGFSETRAQLAGFVERLSVENQPQWQRWALGPRSVADMTAAPAVRAAHDLTNGWSDIQCVTFDLDETLWPTLPPVVQALDEMIRMLATAMPKATAAGATTREKLREALREVIAERPLLSHDFTELRRVALHRLNAAHGDGIPPEAIDEIMRVFVAKRSAVGPHLFSDVLPSIASLRDAGFKVGAITDGNTNVRCPGSGVSDLFDFAITAVDAGATKKSVAPFLQAARAAGCHPSRMVHVGDSITKDITGALRCGMRAVLLERESHAKPSEEEVAARPAVDPARWAEARNLSEVVELLVQGQQARSADSS